MVYVEQYFSCMVIRLLSQREIAWWHNSRAKTSLNARKFTCRNEVVKNKINRSTDREMKLAISKLQYIKIELLKIIFVWGNVHVFFPICINLESTCCTCGSEVFSNVSAIYQFHTFRQKTGNLQVKNLQTFLYKFKRKWRID